MILVDISHVWRANEGTDEQLRVRFQAGQTTSTSDYVCTLGTADH